MTSILRHVAEAFPPARQGTILNNHRVIGIATNTSMVLSYALVTYLMMTAEVGLWDVVYCHTQNLMLYPELHMNFRFLFAQFQQLEKNLRLDFLCKHEMEADLEEVKRNDLVNELLLVNILPKHVAEHFIRQSTTKTVI